MDLQRCSSPEKSGDYQKAYTEWCNEFQKYRSALQTWEEKQTTCLNSNSLQSTTAFQSNNPFFWMKIFRETKKNTCSFLTILSIWSIFVWYIFGSLLNDKKLRHIAQYHKLYENCLNSYLRNLIWGPVNQLMSSNARISLKSTKSKEIYQMINGFQMNRLKI